MANIPRGFLSILQRCHKPMLNLPYKVRFESKSPIDIAIRHRPGTMDKRYLIWSGRFKSMEDIPEHVTVDAMQKAKTKVRIRICNILIVVGLLGSIIMIITGKRAAGRGESVAKMNMDWHKEINAKPK
ncbi:UPF0389 protein GA21628 isoform X2 [Arctopsyche grandis]